MFLEVKTEMSNSTAVAPAPEKSSVRTRGSSSPFRCISNLVQQMNQEKDQELSAARFRVEELEALAASRQKEVFTILDNWRILIDIIFILIIIHNSSQPKPISPFFC